MQKEEFLQLYPTEDAAVFWNNFLTCLPSSLMPYLCRKDFHLGDRVISSDRRSQSVYFLMDGTMWTADDQILNHPCIFSELHAVSIVGDFELFSDMESSYATVTAASDCRCLSLPANLYLKWLSQNAQPLLYRTRLLMKMLGDQTVAQRQYFFMDYTTRCIFLILQHAVFSCQESVRLPLTREILAGKIGCSLRTCHRIVLELNKKNLISVSHGKITVTRTQQRQLHARLETARKELL